ncbi:hypothetical protein [Nonomuraea roseoviolacea]|uniref:Uncharacterized protein n=1 Tax=Nonomuraea roseoviolacea subsp. carminata TaxID=160689 RepID=A0ABT1K466_9ACTN|nr:hypothetical protein [Nonomuraea roseoviolacea]MCP2348382.1 hypothetical protein [Nonomuraea roseoviolacea subsp. carminata]
MSFEERLLMELKAEVAARGAEHRRRMTVRRLFAGAAVAGVAAAAAVAVPLLTGTESPAYAVTKNTDGTIRVQIKEFRDADKLEADLARMGVTADVTYLKAGTWCKPDRGQVAGGEAKTPEEYDRSISGKAIRPVKGGIDIDPKYFGGNRTAVLMYAERVKDEQVGQALKPHVLWQYAGFVVEGPVKPCVAVKNPTWDDVDGQGQPPAGS